MPWTIERASGELRRGIMRHRFVPLPGQGREVYLNAAQFTFVEPWPAGRLGMLAVRAREVYHEWLKERA